MIHLHIDFETFSSVDIKTAGVYQYTASPDFEIMLMSFMLLKEDEQVGDTHVIDFTTMPREKVNKWLESLLIRDDEQEVTIHAHNAQFERLCLRAYGYNIPAERFECSMAKSAYCGLPLGLDQVAKVMGLEEQKDAAGKALIRYFCVPCKPTKVNGGRTRNLPEHDPEKWQRFKDYCRQDTAVEVAISEKLSDIVTPATERAIYILDQKINDRGVLADLQLAQAAIDLSQEFTIETLSRSAEITGLDNANSVAQLQRWVEGKIGQNITKLDKEAVKELLADDCDDELREALENRQALGKTSIKKYSAITSAAGDDQRVRGLFQYYGANRTGRWAGRLVQLQNLPQNQLEGKELEFARLAALHSDREGLELMFDNKIPDLLSQLIRTAFVPARGKQLVIADFSAIEARVIAWLAGEQWRLDVFATHGKIYEASASKMFKIPIESIGKHSDYRKKGKVAELALGYQGGVGALEKMGGTKMGLSENEMRNIVKLWRKESPAIVRFWADIEAAARNTLQTGNPSKIKCLRFIYLPKHNTLALELPSGRRLHYRNARIDKGSIIYEGLDATKTWGRVDTYGGKLTENVVQAIARDILAYTMIQADALGLDLVMHVHDEVVCEELEGEAQQTLDTLGALMAAPPSWAKDMPLRGDGFIANFYQK